MLPPTGLFWYDFCYHEGMRSHLFLFMFVAALLMAGCGHHRQPGTILRQTAQQVGRLDKLSYQASILTRDFEARDTQAVDISVWAKKWPSDPVLGYNIRMKKNGEEYIYQSPLLYFIDHHGNEILKINTSYDPHAIARFPVQNSLFDELLYKDFYRQIERSGYRISLKKTTDAHWVIRVDYPPEEEIDDMYRILWIRKKDYLPEKMEYHVTYNQQSYFQQISLAQLVPKAEFDERLFSMAPMLTEYPLKNYLADGHTGNYISIGQPVPEFEHATLSGERITRQSLRGKIVLMDFWYMDCSACQTSFDHLSELQRKYSDQEFMVLGINGIDRDQQALSAYKKKYAINYPLLMADEYTEKRYSIRVYPTLYLIDRQGKLQYIHHGLSEESMVGIEKKIRELISRP